jgi:hypothetical protein
MAKSIRSTVMAIVKATEIARAPAYPNNRLNARERKVVEVADQFAPADASAWGDTAPSTVTAALNEVAGANILKTVKVVAEVVEDVLEISAHSIPANAVIKQITLDPLVSFDALTSVDINLADPENVESDQLLVDDLLLASLNTLSNLSITVRKAAVASQIEIAVTGTAPTAGKINLFVSYIVSE